MVPKFRRIEDFKSDNVSKILKRFSSLSFFFFSLSPLFCVCACADRSRFLFIILIFSGKYCNALTFLIVILCGEGSFGISVGGFFGFETWVLVYVHWDDGIAHMVGRAQE